MIVKETPVTPVAAIGMACRLPGGIDSPEKLWEALLRGDDLVTEIPAERWDADEYYDPELGAPGRSVSRWGGFLDDVAGCLCSVFRFRRAGGGSNRSAAPVAARDLLGGHRTCGSGPRVAGRLGGTDGAIRRRPPNGRT